MSNHACLSTCACITQLRAAWYNRVRTNSIRQVCRLPQTTRATSYVRISDLRWRRHSCDTALYCELQRVVVRNALIWRNYVHVHCLLLSVVGTRGGLEIGRNVNCLPTSNVDKDTVPEVNQLSFCYASIVRLRYYHTQLDNDKGKFMSGT